MPERALLPLVQVRGLLVPLVRVLAVQGPLPLVREVQVQWWAEEPPLGRVRGLLVLMLLGVEPKQRSVVNLRVGK